MTTCDRIDIVTPYGSGNKDWLRRIHESLHSIPIEWSWYIIADHKMDDGWFSGIFDEFQNTFYARLHPMDNSGWGKNQINYYLGWVQPEERDRWVYVVDDDTIVHPNFCKFDFTRSEDFVIFSQDIGGSQYEGESRIVSDPVRDCAPFGIDQGQMIHKRNFIGDLEYWPIYRGDGYFALESRIRANNNVGVDPEVRSYYNFLKR
tara:strand:+ start:4086 stop:4697 length:612 start_codon:yes stop_codon:yes gene_type:complete